MKKPLAHTKCTVKLRKSEYHDEWYLFVESYPVFKTPGAKPSRIKEALNRIITTPVWDKTRNARTSVDGTVTYKPKRDANGIIMCKSKVDQEACIYADNVRAIRQHEYDSAALYTDSEAEQAAQNERAQCNFITFFTQEIDKRHKHSSDSVYINWKRTCELFKTFVGGDTLIFKQIDNRLIENFKIFLLNSPQGGSKQGCISQNTAGVYFSIFKSVLKQAFVDGYLTIDLAAKVKSISKLESRREHLTLEELNKLAQTSCDYPVIKRAALFSALTGIRHVDIKKMKWKEIVKEGDHYRVNFTQQKTKGVEYTPISEQAYQLCGKRRDDNRLVFEELPAPSWISAPLGRWVKSAGITKHITFHCFRHTFATLQLSHGTDIYTVSKMLGHTDISTTQIYAKVVDEKKETAADAIKINLDHIE